MVAGAGGFVGAAGLVGTAEFVGTAQFAGAGGIVGAGALADVAGLAAEASLTGLVVLTADHRVVWVNRALLRAVGAQTPVRPGPESVAAARVTVAEAGLPLARVAPGERGRVLPWRRPDGSDRQLEVGCRRLPPDRDGGTGLLLYEVNDVTVRQAEADRLAARERRLRHVEAVARTASWEWDVAEAGMRWSDALITMLGFPPGTEVDHASYLELVDPDDLEQVERSLAAALADPGPFSFDHRVTLPDGVSRYVLEYHGDVLVDADGEPVRAVGLARDVTEQAQARRELRHLAEHDPLTGLLNRPALIARLAGAFAAGGGPGAPPRPGSLLVVDVDHLTDTNELRGPAAGDQVLRAVAHRLAETVPEAVVGRLGGDEFGVLLPGGDGERGLAAGRALCEGLARRPVLAGGAALAVTASVGVVPLAGATGVDGLLAMAGLALSEAKRAGGNRARAFAEPQYARAARRVAVVDRFRSALDAGWMALDAQPVVDLATGAVRGHELLARLRDGREPELSPAEFLAAAERTDLAARLDRWVVERAVAALADPGLRASGLTLAVNVSAQSLEDPGFADIVLEALRAARVPAGQLELEITETAALTGPAAARRLADRLTEAGCRFTLDDFGAGLGSLVHLRQLPFTAVKIDGALVGEADLTEANMVAVDAVVRVARSLGMTTVAERVDRPGLLGVLTELGVEAGQGFQLGRPRPLAELLAPAPDLVGAGNGRADPGAITAVILRDFPA